MEFSQVQEKFIGAENNGDLLKLLRVIGAYEFANATDDFCQKHFLRSKVFFFIFIIASKFK